MVEREEELQWRGEQVRWHTTPTVGMLLVLEQVTWELESEGRAWQVLNWCRRRG
jgi:hypothetical protein